jgi:hypothetical protein
MISILFIFYKLPATFLPGVRSEVRCSAADDALHERADERAIAKASSAGDYFWGFAQTAALDFGASWGPGPMSPGQKPFLFELPPFLLRHPPGVALQHRLADRGLCQEAARSRGHWS